MKDKYIKKKQKDKATQDGLLTNHVRLQVLNVSPPPRLNIKR